MPKAEAGWGGKSFLEHVLHTLDSALLKNVFVARHYASPDMLATLRLAVSDFKLENKDKLVSAYLVFPVDFPFVKPETVSALISAHHQNPQAVIRPCFEQRCGHPIVIPTSLNLFTNDEGRGLQGIIRSCQLLTLDIPVDDQGIHRNINKPKDLLL